MNWISIGKSQIEIPSFLKILFPYKEKKLFWMPRNRMLYILLQNKISIIFINWLLQGMFGLNKIDIIGKLVLEILLFTVLFFLINNFTLAAVIFSVLIAHTLNWIFNTHFWVLGRFIGITRTPVGRFYEYLNSLQKRLNKNHGLLGVIILGGISRGEKIRKSSDIDIFFIAQPGIISKIKAVSFTIKARIHASLTIFPLDLYLYEKISEMNKHRKDETPLILFDPENKVKAFYEKEQRNILYFKDFPEN